MSTCKGRWDKSVDIKLFENTFSNKVTVKVLKYHGFLSMLIWQSYVRNQVEAESKLCKLLTFSQLYYSIKNYSRVNV